MYWSSLSALKDGKKAQSSWSEAKNSRMTGLSLSQPKHLDSLDRGPNYFDTRNNTYQGEKQQWIARLKFSTISWPHNQALTPLASWSGRRSWMFVIVFAALIPLMAGTRPRETTPTTMLWQTGCPTTLPFILYTEGDKEWSFKLSSIISQLGSCLSRLKGEDHKNWCSR